MKINRREFLGCSAAIAAMAGGKLSSVALGAPNDTGHTLVVVFLRGGWDALNVLPVLDGKDRGHYEGARPNIKIAAQGKNRALELGVLNGAALGFHPSLAGLHELYRDGKLAVVPASGMASDTRSHFDAMEFLELGTPDSTRSNTGWVARLLENIPSRNSNFSPGISVGDNVTTMLRGASKAVAFNNLNEFRLADDNDYRKFLSDALSKMYAGNGWLENAAQETLRALEATVSIKGSRVAPYPEGGFGEGLFTVAQLMRAGLGVRVATIDLGGWDTHQYQGEGGEGYFADLLSQLSTGLLAFWKDLQNSNATSRVSVVVMSEFGRRLSQNASYGTDHGHGSAMLVLGEAVRGGRLLGRWPGLAPEQLFDRADLAVTTDYRQVFSEVLLRQYPGVKLEGVFPGFKLGQGLGLMG